MRKHPSLIIALTLVIVTVGIGYYLYTTEKRRQAELRESERQSLDPEASALAEGSNPSVPVKLYLYNRGRVDPKDGFLIAEERQIYETENKVLQARQIVNEVLKTRPLFGEEAELRQIYLLEDGTAVVDVSEQTASQLAGGITSEMAAILSITRSLQANIPEISKVRFLIGGRQAETFAGHVSIMQPFM